jgi:hypothetical protein
MQAVDSKADNLRQQLDKLMEQFQDFDGEHLGYLASSVAVSTGLSVGYVIWLVRGGALLGSMLSAMPAWQMIDPLPVLTGSARSRRSADAGDQDQGVEQIFDEREQVPAEPAPEPKPPASSSSSMGSST